MRPRLEGEIDFDRKKLSHLCDTMEKADMKLREEICRILDENHIALIARKTGKSSSYISKLKINRLASVDSLYLIDLAKKILG